MTEQFLIILGMQQADVPADDFGSGIAEHRLGARIPAGDVAVEVG